MHKAAYFYLPTLNPIFKKCRNDNGFQTLLKDTVSYVYSEKEWIDPVVNRTDLPCPRQKEQMPDAMNRITYVGLQEGRPHTVSSVAI